MCGITGLIQKKSGSVKNSQQAVKAMTAVLAHRGPDAEAYFDFENIHFGMRRLAIQDLTPDLYPFTNQSETVHLVFNGEIYNYPELKKELESYGYIFKTHCDGEAIVYGYEKWGTEVFRHLRGMFALAIYDSVNNKTVLARDRLGIKPLYFINDVNYFAFASEVKAFLEVSKEGILPTSFRLDHDQVHHLLGFMFLPESSKTIISGVSKLEPGHYVEISSDDFHSQRYWDLPGISEMFSTDELKYSDAVSGLDDLLTETVYQHLLSDVPLGLMLSGGVDSALIAALMAKKLGVETHTYTAKFDHTFDESNLAAATAQEIGSTHHDIFVDVAEINNNIDKYIDVFDDLSTFDGGVITTSILSKKIRDEGIKVLLLGEGADEVFGGYSWFGLSKMPFNLMPDFLRESLYYYAISRNYSFKIFNYINYWINKTDRRDHTFNDISRKELQIQLPNHLLMKVDKATMSASTEARVPYLDHKVVEYAYKLPANYKLSGNFFNPKKPNEKRILRDVAAKYLPKNIAYRKKKGFLLPMNDVLLSNYENVKSRVLTQNSLSKKMMGDVFVNNLFISSSAKFAMMQKEYFIWRLFLLETWAKRYNLN